MFGLDGMYSRRCFGLRFVNPVLLTDEVVITLCSCSPEPGLRVLIVMLKSMHFDPVCSESPLTAVLALGEDVHSGEEHLRLIAS